MQTNLTWFRNHSRSTIRPGIECIADTQICGCGDKIQAYITWASSPKTSVYINIRNWKMILLDDIT